MPLSPPPRDADGDVVPHDHTEIADADGVIRRISEELCIYDAKLGGRRLSTMAFRPSSGKNGGMSVDLERQIEEAGLDAKAYVTTPKFTGSVRFTAGALRALELQVGYHPVVGNDHHGEVWGDFTKAQQRGLASAAAWFVEIQSVALRSP